jgi:hypothetical protein
MLLRTKFRAGDIPTSNFPTHLALFLNLIFNVAPKPVLDEFCSIYSLCGTQYLLTVRIICYFIKVRMKSAKLKKKHLCIGKWS